MSFFWTAFRLFWKEQARRALWGALPLVLCAAALRCWAVPAPEAPEGAARVGVVLPASGGEGFWQGLEERSGPAVSFVRMDEAALRRGTASGQLDCGLILAEDFGKRLAALDLEGSVTLAAGPASAVAPLVRETASAVIARLASPYIAAGYLRENGMGDAVPEGAEIAGVAVELVTLDGQPLGAPELMEAGGYQILRGTLAVALLVWALATAVDLGRWRDSSAARRLLPLRGGAPLLLPRLLAALLPPLAAGTLWLCLLSGPRTALCVLGLAPYLAALGALALLLANSGLWTALPVLLPFAAAAGFLLSPVFWDITVLFPRLSAVTAHLPVTLYLNLCGGSARAAAELAATAAALGLGAAALERIIK